MQTFANKLHHSFLLRHAFFSLATLLTILILGYYFGTFDQSIHIPFLKQFVNPTLYPNDPLLGLRFTHYSFFWYPFAFFLKIGVLEPAVFIVHVLSIYLTYCALWALSQRLFRNALTSMFSILAFIGPHIGIAGFSVFEFSLLNRTFALPFLLWVFNWYLAGQHYKAFLLLGLVYNLHALSGNFVLFMLGIDILLQFRSFRRGFLCLCAFLLGALPVLLWRFVLYPTSSVPVDRQWFELISDGALYHIFHPFAPYLHILLPTISGLSAVVMIFVFMKKSHTMSQSHQQTIRNSVCAILIILMANALFIHYLPLTVIVQSQLTRSGVFLLIFFYLFAANYVRSIWQSMSVSPVDQLIVTLSVISTMGPVIPAIVYGLRHIVHRFIPRVIITSSFLILSTSVLLYYIISWGVWSPEIHIFGKNTPWKQTQLWAKTHTDPSALFLTPPHLWWFYESDWRVFSERSSLTTITELSEIAFTPEAIASWKERFNDVIPGVYGQFRGNYFENLLFTKQAYANLSLERIRMLAKKYNISYVVIEKPNTYSLPVAYQNEKFIIYSLSPTTGNP